MKLRLVTLVLVLLAPQPPVAAAAPRLTRQVLAEARSQCGSSACVAWVMDTQSVESCHRNIRSRRNRDGSRDHGTAQINDRNPPPWHRGDPYNVHAAVRTMVGAWDRGPAAKRRWTASGKRSATCTWRHLLG